MVQWTNGITSFYQGDCREVLAELPAESVQCVVTSPPYWGLRDYGTSTWEGGNEECDHAPDRNSPSSKLEGGKTTQGMAKIFKEVCLSCGAKRIDNQLGLEPTPDAYVANMVEVFRGVRRVLRDDGTVWLNLGDSYAGSGKGQMGDGTHSREHGTKQGTSKGTLVGGLPTHYDGIKPKDLVGIPWRVAFALQADGWYLRSDIIWTKPNPMPESVTDRPTKSHEYIFLLTKNAHYYYDADAIREPHLPVTMERIKHGLKHKHPDNIGVGIPPVDTTEMGDRFAHTGGRNKRDVWEITVQGYSEAHFATFPEALVKPCILAGTKEQDTVLDPFAGSGTVMQVAQGFGRNSIGVELNDEYIGLAVKRLERIPLPMKGII